MIFKSTPFPPKASSSTCLSLCPDKEPQVLANLSTNVDSKLTEKGLQVYFRLPFTLASMKTFRGNFSFKVKIFALCVASTMTSRARLHRFAEKRHSPAHSEVPNGPVTKISYIYIYVCVCFSNPNIFLVSD